MTPLRIDVVSDVVCPWCYIGKRRLEAALRQRPEIEVDLHWRPYMLDASIPTGGYDRNEYMVAKFGSPERRDAMFARVTEEAKAEGIEFDLAAIERSPNTLNAHRLIHWAEATEKQSAVKEALLSAFFCEGRDVGDADVLTDIAAQFGFERGSLAKRFATGDDVQTVQSQIEEAQSLGVSGVPFFILAERIGLPGAQPADVIAQVMDDAVNERSA